MGYTIYIYIYIYIYTLQKWMVSSTINGLPDQVSNMSLISNLHNLNPRKTKHTELF